MQRKKEREITRAEDERQKDEKTKNSSGRGGVKKNGANTALDEGG